MIVAEWETLKLPLSLSSLKGKAAGRISHLASKIVDKSVFYHLSVEPPLGLSQI